MRNEPNISDLPEVLIVALLMLIAVRAVNLVKPAPDCSAWSISLHCRISHR